MVENDRTQPRDTAEKSALKICVVGVGGAGSNVIDRITTDRTLDATLISMQTDVRVLHHSLAPRKLQLGAELMRGVGAGGDPDLGREAALYSKDQIREAIDGNDMVFISVGLGGGTGSGAAPVIAEIARSTGATVLVFAAVPFNFEGRRRTTQAREALERLQKSADALILFENKRMGELLLPKDGIQKAFVLADTLISQSVRAVTTMLSSQGLVKLGLADLSAALRVADGRCLFGFGEAKGQNRGTEALKRALKSPLINQGHLLQHAKNLLVHIVGGESLTIAEVEVVMKQLGRHVPDDTHILFGLGVDAKLGESLSVTLFSALSASQLDQLSLEEAEEVPAVPERKATPRTAPKDTHTLELFPSSNASAEAVADEVEEVIATPPPLPKPSPAMKAAVVAVEPPPAELYVPTAPEPKAPTKPAARTALIAKAVAPPPAPEPVVEDETEPESEVVYQRDLDEPEEDAVVEELDDEPVYVATAPVKKAEPGMKLAQVIGLGQTPARAEARPHMDTAVDQIELTEEPEPEEPESLQTTPPPVLRAQPETVSVPLPRSTPTVRSRPVTESIPIARTPEPSSDNEHFDPVAALIPATPRAKPLAPTTSAEQQTFSLGQEDRGKFKDTEPAIVQGEDLDVPTWMRMRKKLRR